MHNVLIYHDNPNHLRKLADEFKKHEEFSVLTATKKQEAIAVLDSRPIDIVIVDLRISAMHGFFLISHMQNAHPNLPAILLSSVERFNVEDYVYLNALPGSTETPAIVDEARHVLGQGSHTINLSLILEGLQLEKRSCELSITSLDKQGNLYFAYGEFIDAEVKENKKQQEEAAYEILQWSDVHIEMKAPKTRTEPFIKASLQEILMEVSAMDSSRDEPMTDQAVASPSLEMPESSALVEDEAFILDELLNEGAQEDPEIALQEEREVKEESHIEQEHTEAQEPVTDLEATKVEESDSAEENAKELAMSNIRQPLAMEAEKLQETFKRLQERVQVADEALKSVMEECQAFTQQRQAYEQAEETYLKRQQRLEGLRSDAEALAQQLLSVVKQVDEEPKETEEPVAVEL